MNDKIKISNMTSISLVVWIIGWWFTMGYFHALGYSCIIQLGNGFLNYFAGFMVWPIMLGYACAGGR